MNLKESFLNILYKKKNGERSPMINDMNAAAIAAAFLKRRVV